MPVHDEIREIAALLPRTTPGAAATARLVHDRRFVHACSLAGFDITVSHGRSMPPAPLYRLELRCDAGTAHVTTTAPDAASLALLADGRLSHPILEAGLDVALAPMLDALRALGFAGMRAVALHRLDQAPACDAWAVVRHEDGELATIALPELPDGMQRGLGELLRSTPVLPNRTIREGVSLRGAVELASRPLRRSLLTTLAVGDVLLLNVAEQEPDTPCQVRFGIPGCRRWTAVAHIQEDTITLQGAAAMAHDDFDDDMPEAMTDGTVGLNDLEIPVRFEIETVRMALQDLESMLPGAVIPLASPLSTAALRLVAGGRTIGHAELVAVGDRLGARILHIATQQGE
jgi:type III secretion protein Q